MGRPDVALNLLLSKDPSQRLSLVRELVGMNDERRKLGDNAWKRLTAQADESLAAFGGRFVLVIDDQIPRGITGILAGRFARDRNVPATVIARLGDNCIGSIRSVRGLHATDFLSRFSDLLGDFGGHDGAGGFHFDAVHWDALRSRMLEVMKDIELGSVDDEKACIDIVIQADKLGEAAWNTVATFVPTGQMFAPLLFCIQAIKVRSASVLGKDGRHLSLELESASGLWSAVWWDGIDAWKRELDTGDVIDVLCELERNQFRTDVRPQIVIKQVRKHQKI